MVANGAWPLTAEPTPRERDVADWLGRLSREDLAQVEIEVGSGPLFLTPADRYRARLVAIAAFVAEHGHVPRAGADATLHASESRWGFWLTRQRGKERAGTLKASHLEMLEDLVPAWRGSQAQFRAQSKQRSRQARRDRTAAKPQRTLWRRVRVGLHESWVPSSLPALGAHHPPRHVDGQTLLPQSRLDGFYDLGDEHQRAEVYAAVIALGSQRMILAIIDPRLLADAWPTLSHTLPASLVAAWRTLAITGIR